MFQNLLSMKRMNAYWCLMRQINLVEEEIKLEEARLQNDIRLQEAKIEKALANILEEETRLSYATVTAPIDGVIAFVSTQEGETVVASMSAPTFVTLIDLKKLEVTAFVDETDIGKIKEKQQANSLSTHFQRNFFKQRFVRFILKPLSRITSSITRLC